MNVKYDGKAKNSCARQSTTFLSGLHFANFQRLFHQINERKRFFTEIKVTEKSNKSNHIPRSSCHFFVVFFIVMQNVISNKLKKNVINRSKEIPQLIPI